MIRFSPTSSEKHGKLGGHMTTARTNPERDTSASTLPDQMARQRPRASKLFEKDHAYAARLVQIATAIGSVLRSTITLKLPDQDPSGIREDDGITTGIAEEPPAHRAGP